MESVLLEMVEHVAPQVGILIVIVVWQNKRLEKIEERLQDMLGDCWDRFMAHLESEGK